MELFKKLFPLYFKLKDAFIAEKPVDLTDSESVDLAFFYVLARCYPIVIIITIAVYEFLKQAFY